MNEIVSMFKATMWLYGECAKDATNALRKNWIIPLLSIAAYFAFIVAASALQTFGMVGMFVLGLIEIALLTLFYGWLSEAVRKNTLRRNDLLNFDYGIFSGLISVAFLIWVLNWVLGSLIQGLQVSYILAFVGLAIAVFLNPIPEILYLRGTQSTAAVQESFTFVKDNWLEWFFPFVVLISPLIISVPSLIALLLSQMQPLLPVSMVIAAASRIFPNELGHIAALLSITIAVWFLIFRGFLFLGLESGSRRRRAFLARQK